MLSGEPRVPVATLRDAVRQAVERTSSHAVAREVGMSAPSLRDFIAGSEPRTSTARKLMAWYVRRHEIHGSLDAATADAALGLLVEHIPLDQRDQAHRRVLDLLRRITGEAGVSCPPWISGLQNSGGSS
jgi:hypothetical protein